MTGNDSGGRGEKAKKEEEMSKARSKDSQKGKRFFAR